MFFYFVKIDTLIVLHKNYEFIILKKVFENTTYCFDKTCAVIISS